MRRTPWLASVRSSRGCVGPVEVEVAPETEAAEDGVLRVDRATLVFVVLGEGLETVAREVLLVAVDVDERRRVAKELAAAGDQAVAVRVEREPSEADGRPFHCARLAVAEDVELDPFGRERRGAEASDVQRERRRLARGCPGGLVPEPGGRPPGLVLVLVPVPPSVPDPVAVPVTVPVGVPVAVDVLVAEPSAVVAVPGSVDVLVLVPVWVLVCASAGTAAQRGAVSNALRSAVEEVKAARRMRTRIVPGWGSQLEYGSWGAFLEGRQRTA